MVNNCPARGVQRGTNVDINNVIAALSARLGLPDATAIFKGNPCASWGTTRWPGPGVDAYVFADGTTRVDLYNSGPERFVLPGFVIAECAFVPVDGRRFIPHAVLNSVEAVDAYDGIAWPVIVPLVVAVDLAARVMGKSAPPARETPAE